MNYKVLLMTRKPLTGAAVVASLVLTFAASALAGLPPVVVIPTNEPLQSQGAYEPDASPARMDVFDSAHAAVYHFSALKWRGWGSARARASGRAWIECHGCSGKTARARIVLSAAVRMHQCGEVVPARGYTRAAGVARNPQTSRPAQPFLFSAVKLSDVLTC
jgi:hypothetical protein